MLVEGAVCSGGAVGRLEVGDEGGAVPNGWVPVCCVGDDGVDDCCAVCSGGSVGALVVGVVAGAVPNG